MTFTRIEWAGMCAALALVVLGGIFAFSQITYAQEIDPCSVPGMVVFGCDEEGSGGVPVDPCDIADCSGDQGEGDSLAEHINCEIYAQLIAAGEPIPDGFDASGCDDGGDGDGDGDGGGDGDGDGDGGGGGGGGSPPACSDSQDNDNDGKTDMDDPDCTDAQDDDESTPSSGGGSGGGGGGGGGGGSVAGAAAAACDKYLTAFIKFGQNNDVEQVKRLQRVLKDFEGAPVEESGTYDEATLGAVHSFQTKYADSILAPWGIAKSTGFVYLTTRKKVNEIYCKNVVFPLTDEENAVIEKSKHEAHVAPAQTAAAAVPDSPTKTAPAAKDGDEEEMSAPEEESAVESPWRSIGDFFRRLLGR